MIRRLTTPDENGRVWDIADIRTQAARDLDAEIEARGYEVFYQQDDFGQPIAGIPAVPGIRITPESALLCSVVCACIRVISETCAQLPLHLVKNLPNGGKERETSNPIYRLLHTAPNKRHSSFTFRELLTSWCALYGNAYAEIVRTRGQITALVPLHPSRMSLERLENKTLRFRYSEPTGGVTYYKEEDIFHLPWMSADGLTGMMPVGLARDAIQMARACEIHGIGFFANSARPSVVLETEHSIPPEAQERLREAWERVHRGPAQAGKTAILPNGLKAHELGQSNSDQQYLELRQFQIAEIARIWRVPPHLVGDLSRATFSNIESQGLDFLNYCIMPWIRRWESAIAMSILADEPECSAEFDVRGLMRADSATRASYYQTCMNLGIYSLNEVRDLETLPPVEGGDVRFVTLNVQTLEAALAAAKTPAPETPAGPEPGDAENPAEDAEPGDKEADAKTGKMQSRNCGTGAGGFQPGNNCAAGGDGEESEAGESAEHENAERTSKLIDVLTKPENADGFTVDPVGFESPQTGIMVSLNKEQNAFSAAEIASGAADEKILGWIAQMRRELDSGDNKFIGGWLDSGDGKFYLDVATRFEPEQAKEVLEAARDARQYAVFNLETKRDTWVVYDQDDPRRPDDYDAQFAKWLASRGLTSDDYTYGRDSVRSIDDFLDDICRRARLFDALRRAGVAEKEIPALADRALKRYKNVRSRSHQHSGESQRSRNSRRSESDGGESIGQFAVAEKVASGDNCGTGKGGFQPGNTCAKGGDGGGSSSTKEEPESEARTPSAENCPEPCEMLRPLKDGDTLNISSTANSSSIEAFDWDAAESVDSESEQAIRSYTGSEYDQMNQHLRDGGELDEYTSESEDPFGGLSSDELIEQYGNSDETPVSDASALEEINSNGPVISDWQSAEDDVDAVYDDLRRGDIDGVPEFDPTKNYTNFDVRAGENTVVIEHATDDQIKTLNESAERIMEYREQTGHDTAGELIERINELVSDHTSQSEYDPSATYVDYDIALENAQQSYLESGDAPSGERNSLVAVEEGLKWIAAQANPDGKLFASYRGIRANTYAKKLAESAKVGDLLDESGFFSASASPKFAVDWKGSSTGVYIRVLGRRGAPIDSISDNKGEKEVLFPHESTFRITGVAKDITISTDHSGVKASGVTVIDVIEEDS